MAKCAVVLVVGALLGADGIRKRQKRRAAHRTIAGVPVMNYHMAYGGQPSGLELEDGVKEHWLVFANKDTSEDQLTEFCARSSGGCEQMGHPSDGGIPFFEVHATERELEELLAGAAAGLAFVEPDTEAFVIPELDAAATAASWGLDRVGAPTRARTGRGTHVYVLDTGIRASHADFGGRAVAAMDLAETGTPIDCTEDLPNCARDGNGHGTHCAGTAAGGTYGVAIGASVYGVKVMGDAGFGSMSWIYTALDFLARGRALRPTVASMSLGGTGVLSGMEAAINTAAGAGVTVVVAGGNSNADSCGFTPAFVPSAITVGSTASGDERSYFSNFGSCTDIWAPGSAITSASHETDTGSATFSGTSMACPHVSGAAALVLEADPALMPAGVLAAMLATAEAGAITDLYADDTNKLLWVGGGPAPVPAPTPPPPARPECNMEFAVARWPDGDGDCKCKELNWFTQLYCSLSGPGSGKYDCPQSGASGKFAGLYFNPSCTECTCMTYGEIMR